MLIHNSTLQKMGIYKFLKSTLKNFQINLWNTTKIVSVMFFGSKKGANILSEWFYFSQTVFFKKVNESLEKSLLLFYSKFYPSKFYHFSGTTRHVWYLIKYLIFTYRLISWLVSYSDHLSRKMRQQQLSNINTFNI